MAGGSSQDMSRCPSCGTGQPNLERLTGGMLFCHVEGKVTGRVSQDASVTAASAEDFEGQTRTIAPSAGWYLDPYDDVTPRYYDGVAWTENRQKGVTAKPFPGVRTVSVGEARDDSSEWMRVRVVTTENMPGRTIQWVMGEVWGLKANSRGPFSDAAARVRTAVGGEVASYGKLMLETRTEVMARLRQACFERGGDAVLATRFDTTPLTDDMVECVAYGTAVKLQPLPGGAQP